MDAHLDLARHSIEDPSYVESCRSQLDRAGALVLEGFFTEAAVVAAVAESEHREGEAFYANSTHNVYLTDPDPDLPASHAFNRQVVSSKGLIADDQIPADSPLRHVYNNPTFQAFLCGVLGIDEIHPYADALSSINVHFASEGKELGWHFDNSSFAVTMLLRAPDGGGNFEYVPDVRNANSGEMAYDTVAAVLDGEIPVKTLDFDTGDLVLFRGRNALHRVTPTHRDTSPLLVVFAYTDAPAIGLSDAALRTFYGRTG